MDFELSKEQKDIQKAARRFAKGEFDRELALELEEKHEFPTEIWKKAADEGFIGLHYPAEYGGSGYGVIKNTLVVEEFCRRQGYPPTVREVAARFGVQPRAAADHLAALKRKGYLHREPGRSRGLALVSRLEDQVVEVPILGRIAAGQPLLAAEQVEDTLSLPRAWVRGEEVFLLRVSGESMAPLLLPGDLVMVRVQPRVSRGEIAVVLVDEKGLPKGSEVKGVVAKEVGERYPKIAGIASAVV